MTDGISTDSLIDAYTLLANQVPVISSVLPPRGGTAGGTLIAIGGSGFGYVSWMDDLRFYVLFNSIQSYREMGR